MLSNFLYFVILYGLVLFGQGLLRVYVSWRWISFY